MEPASKLLSTNTNNIMNPTTTHSHHPKRNLLTRKSTEQHDTTMPTKDESSNKDRKGTIKRPDPPPRNSSFSKRHASFNSPREVPLPSTPGPTQTQQQQQSGMGPVFDSADDAEWELIAPGTSKLHKDKKASKAAPPVPPPAPVADGPTSPPSKQKSQGQDKDGGASTSNPPPASPVDRTSTASLPLPKQIPFSALPKARKPNLPSPVLERTASEVQPQGQHQLRPPMSPKAGSSGSSSQMSNQSESSSSGSLPSAPASKSPSRSPSPSPVPASQQQQRPTTAPTPSPRPSNNALRDPAAPHLHSAVAPHHLALRLRRVVPPPAHDVHPRAADAARRPGGGDGDAGARGVAGGAGGPPPPEPPVILDLPTPDGVLPPQVQQARSSRPNSNSGLLDGAGVDGKVDGRVDGQGHAPRRDQSDTSPNTSNTRVARNRASTGGGQSQRASYEPFLSHAPPPVDSWIEVETTQGEYRLIVRLPGFKRDGITLATKKRRILHVVADSWEEGGGHFERRISFGYDADLAQVRAEFDGELLRVIIPRRIPPAMAMMGGDKQTYSSRRYHPSIPPNQLLHIAFARAPGHPRHTWAVTTSRGRYARPISLLVEPRTQGWATSERMSGVL
ncbi:CBS-domain-containing protein [Mycena venus]|uniref:CBS-domain-containing protein n=1 Tax=Mycena venus TaxID=2733690 RepID=A0A8H7D0S1_9AGAR|nr:CBS-domain-containing protein [Mycena venus]